MPGENEVTDQMSNSPQLASFSFQIPVTSVDSVEDHSWRGLESPCMAPLLLVIILPGAACFRYFALGNLLMVQSWKYDIWW